MVIKAMSITKARCFLTSASNKGHLEPCDMVATRTDAVELKSSYL